MTVLKCTGAPLPCIRKPFWKGPPIGANDHFSCPDRPFLRLAPAGAGHRAVDGAARLCYCFPMIEHPKPILPLTVNRRRLPSMGAMTAFEAAARLGSFTEAAKELHLTQGAVSRQVKALEDQIQVQLFKRTAQRIELTDIGRSIAVQVRSILDQFLVAMEQASSSEPTALVLGVLPAVASRWLIPSLSSFTDEHPHIDIQLTRPSMDFATTQTPCDAILTVDSEIQPEMISHKIGSEEFIAVGSPQWIADHHVSTVRDLADKRLLVEAARPEIWNKWFVVNGMPQHLHTRYMRFDYFDMVIAAALNHLGIALVPRLLVESDIAAGRLQRLDSQSLSVGTSYVLSYPPHKAQFPPLFVFRNWLLSGLPEPA